MFESDRFSDLPEALIRAHKVKKMNVSVSPNLFVIILNKSNKMLNLFWKSFIDVNKFCLLGLFTTEEITMNMTHI